MSEIFRTEDALNSWRQFPAKAICSLIRPCCLCGDILLEYHLRNNFANLFNHAEFFITKSSKLLQMQEKYKNVVTLHETRADVMKCIIDFIYTGQLSINHDNAFDLIATADYLCIKRKVACLLRIDNQEMLLTQIKKCYLLNSVKIKLSIVEISTSVFATNQSMSENQIS